MTRTSWREWRRAATLGWVEQQRINEERARQDEQLARGMRLRLQELPRRYARCLERWPGLAIWSRLASGPGGLVSVTRGAGDVIHTRACERPIAGLTGPQMSLLAVARLLVGLEALEVERR